jgi:hypothetical protein
MEDEPTFFLVCLKQAYWRVRRKAIVVMALTLFVLGGVLGGIAGLVAFEAVSEGIGCSSKLHDRYHE